ncbi:MAG: transposase zinc-binding domain-containing protein [Deltaproteobacteria bacterium]|nr:transposase zinc-binding domain-containing protein [Deltaproteobacteria bacterium]
MTTAQAIDRNSAVYHPRIPTASPLYKLLSDNFPGFVASYDTKFSRSHGFFRQFTRVRCPDCYYEYLLAFFCRGRWFCPSCHAKKVIQFGEVLRENILYPVPHRHDCLSFKDDPWQEQEKLLNLQCRGFHCSHNPAYPWSKLSSGQVVWLVF